MLEFIERYINLILQFIDSKLFWNILLLVSVITIIVSIILVVRVFRNKKNNKERIAAILFSVWITLFNIIILIQNYR